MVGPMPLEDFFADQILCPPPTETLPPDDLTRRFKEAVKDINETRPGEDMYRILPDALNDVKCCGSFTRVGTRTSADMVGCYGDSVPDFCSSLNESLSNTDPQQSVSESSWTLNVTSKDGHSTDRTKLQLAPLILEMTQGFDPFYDPEPGDDLSMADVFRTFKNEEDTEQAMSYVGQLTQRSARLLAQQYRTFCFIILVCGPKARIIRWDRAGAVITCAFDYTTTEYLLQFLWRYNHASEIDRGFDTSHDDDVTTEEEKASKRAIEQHIETQFFDDKDTADQVSFPQLVAEHYEPGNVSKMNVYNEKTKLTQQYLVSIPLCLPENAAGRCTRGYWGVKVNDPEGKVVFVKDTWRTYEENARKEGVTHEVLNEGEVENVPTLCAHGDFRHGNGCENYQRTTTQMYLDKSWVARAGRDVAIATHVHYRLVLKEAAIPLDHLKDSSELLRVGRDVLTAIQGAVSIRLLHRDVSYSNIMLFHKEKGSRRIGFLTDWDFSCTTNKKGVANDTYRTGTWAFMSLNALQCSLGFRHVVQDDMESLTYVLLFCSMILLEHSEVPNFTELVTTFFHDNPGLQSTPEVKPQMKESWTLNYALAARAIRSFGFNKPTSDAFRMIFRDLYVLYTNRNHLAAENYDKMYETETGSTLQALHEEISVIMPSEESWTPDRLAFVLDEAIKRIEHFPVKSRTMKWRRELDRHRKLMAVLFAPSSLSKTSNKRDRQEVSDDAPGDNSSGEGLLETDQIARKKAKSDNDFELK